MGGHPSFVRLADDRGEREENQNHIQMKTNGKIANRKSPQVKKVIEVRDNSPKTLHQFNS